MRAGFPHSDICGSKLVCQLPAAFRRLPRPSSPVIAKASTTCTYSLDPITLSAPALRCQIPDDRCQIDISHLIANLRSPEHRSYRLFQRLVAIASLLQMRQRYNHQTQSLRSRLSGIETLFTSSEFLKNSQPVQASELNIQSSALPDSCFLTPDSC